jgi:hypothetical protein
MLSTEVKIKKADKKKEELRVRLHIYIDKKPHILSDDEQRNNKKERYEPGAGLKIMSRMTWLFIMDDYIMRNG